MKTHLFTALLACSVWLSSTLAACPEIVTRAGWGARVARSRSQMGPAVGHVFIHHTAGAKCTDKASCIKVARQTQNYHMDSNKWSDLGYSFLVGGDGRIYEGRGWKGVGAHTPSYNSKSLGISFMGNFDKALPSIQMINAAKNLIDCGVSKGFITAGRQIHGHRDAKCTACPGEALYNNVKGWVGFKGGKLPGYTC